MRTALNIRDMPGELLHCAKIVAAIQGVTLKEFVIRALEKAVKEAGPLPGIQKRKPRR